MEKKRKTSLKLLLGWPTQTVAYAMYSVLITYASFYATDFMRIPAIAVGFIFMISKVFDGITDLIAGFIIDKTSTRWGKGRPYAFAMVGCWISLVLLFGAPEMSKYASYIYLFVMYSLVNSVFITLYNCSEPVYLANALENQDDSVKVLSIAGFVTLLATLVANMIIPQLINSFTTRAQWRGMVMVMAIVMSLFSLIRFVAVKEVKQSSKKMAEDFSIKSMIQLLAKNKYILIFAVIMMTSGIGNAIVTGVQTYYFQYVIGDIGKASIFALSMLSVIVIMLFMPILSKKFGFVNVMRATSLIGMFGYLIRIFAPTNMVLLVGSNVLAMTGFYTLFAFVNTYVIDCVDYGEWKNGVRSEGTIASAQSVASKFASAIGAAAVGLILGLAGYSGDLVVQPQSANTVILLMFSVIPAAFCLLQFLLLVKYDLDKKLPQIREELKEKRNV